MTSMTERLEKSITKALARTENNRYLLSHIIGKRANQLMQGEEPLLDLGEGTYKETDMAILEIAEGKLDLTPYLTK